MVKPSQILADRETITQEIRYHMPQAGQVFLAWGIEGWAELPEEQRPSGTVIRDGIMHTLMTRDGDFFVAQVQVPADVTVDYGFLVTKTRYGDNIAPIWDGEYQLSAADGNVNVMESRPTLTDRWRLLGISDIKLYLLTMLCTVLGVSAVLDTADRARPRRSKRRILSKLALLVAILLLAFSLRIHDLGAESLWTDEGTSWRLAKQGISAIIENRSQTVNPPLYFIILHYWVRVFGDSEVSLRLPSVLFGLLSIPMIYKIGSAIFDKKVGALASLLLAIAMIHIRYSQEARGYSLMALLALVSMYYFIGILQTPSLARSTGYVIATGLLLYTHFYGLLIVLCQNIYYLTILTFSSDDTPLRLRSWILTQAILFLSFMPWLRVLITQVLVIQDGYWIPTPSIQSLLETLLEYAGSSRLLLGIFAAFLLLSFISLTRRRQGNAKKNVLLQSAEKWTWSIRLSHNKMTLLLLLWLVVPILLPFVLSQFSTPIYYTRYTLAASLPVYILVAKGLRSMGSLLTRSIAILFIIVLSLVRVDVYYGETTNEQWRDLANHIVKNAEPGDLVLLSPGGIGDLAFDYYFDRTDLILKPINMDTDLATELSRFIETETLDDVAEIVEGRDRVWLVQSQYQSNRDPIGDRLSRSYTMSEHEQYRGPSSRLFEKDKATAMPAQIHQLVTQEIRYRADGIHEASLVWGIDGWSTISGENRPTGTIVKSGVMHTPMFPEGDDFVANIQVPSGTMVDYGFLLTKQVSDAKSKVVWDGDYQLVATHNGASDHQATRHSSYIEEQRNGLDARQSLLLSISVAVGVGIVTIIRRSITSNWWHLNLHLGMLS
jgi:uncharacterized membrane protein